MTPAAIETRDLTKFYGKTKGIEGVDLQVEAGEVFGFLGPNGSGKSTTIRVLLDLIRPTRGSARILGLDSRADSLEIRRRIRYLPAEMALPGQMTGQQAIDMFDEIRGVTTKKMVMAMADRLDLDLGRRVGAYSTGNRRKVGLVHAFADHPEVIVLDEPTSGLDPLIRQEFYGMVAEARAAGQTVFLSSHNLPEVERVADRVAIVRDGELVAIADIDELKGKALRRLEIRFAEPVAASELATVESVIEHETSDGDRVHIATVRGSVDALVKTLARFEVTSLITHEAGLEEIFLDYYRGGEE